jgi:5-methyltetrahydropteroyltriglutamate--homocysteine methyltransferase
MRRSTERILTTHAGSLPRPDELRDLLIAKDEGRPYDHEAFATRVRSAVAEMVQRQVALGIDIINDGEQAKRGFSTYVRERFSGLTERPPTPEERPAMISGRDMPEFAEYFASRGGFAGTDCGLGGRVGHPKIVWAKFEALAEGAQLATQQLWNR